MGGQNQRSRDLKLSAYFFFSHDFRNGNVFHILCDINRTNQLKHE